MANAKDKRSKKKSRKGRDESRDEMGAGFAHDAYCSGLGSEDGKLPEWSRLYLCRTDSRNDISQGSARLVME
ncbi:hypothetical protein FVEG_16074 [Fusarium verticillioides 7600]|uniref:Uncharacterized protein n=1 Tax=Gibberella moniliformis (strain M3125 / FGSC 7600) TaxID=334819 RepID=W7MHP9_GIBM7|nr:hypothetical protein FVEG_16074 [Fusarium verticillioides 7600]EWG47109.1 hypothetical protein FVEG_16074 [Fusarium verticillioides 7600]